MSKITRSGRRSRLLVPMSITVAGLAIASAAWACAPAPDPQTYFQSCQQPSGARYACKPLLGTPAFPSATSIKGNAGARVTAFVSGGQTRSAPHEMLFASKPFLAGGGTCTTGAAISAIVLAGVNGNIPNTMGTIPTNAPLGAGQVCFADAGRRLNTSRVASFKVIV